MYKQKLHMHLIIMIIQVSNGAEVVMLSKEFLLEHFTKTISNEGTKVQNPRRLCHVHCNIHVYTWQYAYGDKCVSVRGSIRKFGKDKSSSSLLPKLRDISGTA